MNITQWWKNFDLNTELHTAGGFIYDGLHQLRQCQHLHHDDELFAVLYHLSVGFERLTKVAIVLLEHTEKTNQHRFEESLKTHNLEALLGRVRKKRNLNIAKAHHALIHCLSEFYHVFRYDRYVLATVRQRDRLRESFQLFVEKGSGIKIGNAGELFQSVDMRRVQRYVGKIAGKLSEQLYSAITEGASQNQIFTNELRSDSKAFKIFLRQEYDFESEGIALKELLLFLMRAHHKTDLKKIIHGVRALPFDPPEAIGRLDAFTQLTDRFDLVDMVGTMHEDVRRLHERKELLDYFGPEVNGILTDEEAEGMGGPPNGN